MMMSAAECRAKAAEMLAIADGASDPLKASFEQLAAEWRRLALTADYQETMQPDIFG
jgi:hypothetical protein